MTRSKRSINHKGALILVPSTLLYQESPCVMFLGAAPVYFCTSCQQTPVLLASVKNHQITMTSPPEDSITLANLVLLPSTPVYACTQGVGRHGRGAWPSMRIMGMVNRLLGMRFHFL